MPQALRTKSQIRLPDLDYAEGVHLALTDADPDTTIGPVFSDAVAVFYGNLAFAFRGDGEPAVWNGNGSISFQAGVGTEFVILPVTPGAMCSFARSSAYEGNDLAVVHLDVVPLKMEPV